MDANVVYDPSIPFRLVGELGLIWDVWHMHKAYFGFRFPQEQSRSAIEFLRPLPPFCLRLRQLAQMVV